MTAPLKSFAYCLPIEVCLRDLDGLGHVNNAVYLTYLETARNKYVFGLIGKQGLSAFEFILARTEIDFRAAATMHQIVNVSLRPTRVGDSSWAFEYEIREAESDRLLVEANSVQVTFNYQTNRPEPVSEEFRRLLEDERSRCGG